MVQTDFKINVGAPGVNDRFLAIGSSNFPQRGESTAIQIAISKLVAARKKLAFTELSVDDVITLAEDGTLPGKPSINLIDLGLTANEVTAAAIVEITFAAVSLSQALPAAERPILDIDNPEWQVLVAIQSAYNAAK